MERISTKIELFGLDLRLHVRNASDVLDMVEFVGSHNLNLSLSIFQAAKTVESALVQNRKSIQKARFWQRKACKKANEDREFNRKLKSEYLMDNLSVKELSDLANKVYVMEGLTASENGAVKKKANESAGELAED